jgi:pimeloyl-ACP methyl ester carboxylesterase
LLAAAYAGRYSRRVIGVLNFSGGWWSEDAPNADFNLTEFRRAGHGATVPMLWLYAEHDSYYSLAFVEREFAAFRSAGGRGELFEVRGLPGEGHYLSEWLDRWEAKVTDYLSEINGPTRPTNEVPANMVR